MKIILEINEADINKIAGDEGVVFVMSEFRRDPAWFVKHAAIAVFVKDDK